jgi:hypothetical protein
MTTYRFGAMAYTLDEIRDIARRHGEDGIMYYPPQCWGQMTHKGQSTVPIPLRSGDPLEIAYLEAYKAGYYSRHSR